MIDTKSFKLTYSDFNFLDIVNEVLQNLYIIFKYEKVDIVFKEKETVMLRADKKRLMIALECIILNLINYAKPNTTIYVSIKKNKNRLHFEVENQGRIIQENEQKRMYEKFKKAPSCYLGRGVDTGMYLTKEIISRHFGQVITKCKEDGLNTFGFILPL